MTDEATLLEKINAAVKAANEAEATVETAKTELVARSKAVGLLLLEAKKLHPEVADFKAFLGKVHGLKLSCAYDLLRLAGGRTTDEEIRQATKDRVKKHRDKKKRELPSTPPKITTQPEKDSVTPSNVTESVEASAERRKAEYAKQEEDARLTPEEKAAKVSAKNLI
jgi:hypothetical protein